MYLADAVEVADTHCDHTSLPSGRIAGAQSSRAGSTASLPYDTLIALAHRAPAAQSMTALTISLRSESLVRQPHAPSTKARSANKSSSNAVNNRTRVGK